MHNHEQKGISGPLIVLFIIILGILYLVSNTDSFNSASEEDHANVSVPEFTNEINVLFIGNSLTSTNNLPKVIASIAQSKGKNIKYTKYLKAGARLSRHARDKKLSSVIREQRWDYVVLQEQSQFPAFDEWQLRNDMYPYVDNLIQKVRHASHETKIVFYVTMAHKNGDRMNRKVVPENATYLGMQNRIIRTYKYLAEQYDELLAPVGVVWREMRSKHPEIRLYTDDRHPTIAGTYLAACAFYSTFFTDQCQGGKIVSKLPQSEGILIQKISDSIMFSNKLTY